MASALPTSEPMTTQGNLAENWKFFKQMWRNYEIASGLAKKQPTVKSATSAVVMGKECFQILQNLALTEEQRNSSTEVINRLDEYFLPRSNVIYERYKFNARDQAANESIDKYVTNLRHLAASCEFGNLKDQLIRDRIVLGICDDNLRSRLLRENPLVVRTFYEIFWKSAN